MSSYWNEIQRRGREIGAYNHGQIDRGSETDDPDLMLLEALVYADSAHVADLVLAGRSTEADTYAQRPEVAARILLWKKNR